MTNREHKPETHAHKEGNMQAGDHGFAPVFSTQFGQTTMRVRLLEKLGSCWRVVTADLRSVGRELLVFEDKIQPETEEVRVIRHRLGLVAFEV